jgi:hypothetical protein
MAFAEDAPERSHDRSSARKTGWSYRSTRCEDG